MKVRERVFDLFVVYQKLKRDLGFWDEGDLVLNLFRRLRTHGPSGVLIHHAFVDEVQDFTQAELFVVLSLCRDPDRCFLAGDTAQTIAKGCAVVLFLFYSSNPVSHIFNPFFS
jgi:superfamily I DNA/RNA helicase